MVHRARHAVTFWIVVIALVGCSGASTAPSGDATPTPIPTPIVPTKPTYVVQRGEVVNTVQFTGRIAPVVEESLFFRSPGYVANVFVKRNDWVEEGDIIAELEVTDLKNRLAEAEAALQSALANNEQRQAEARAEVLAAELNLARLKAIDPSLDMVNVEVSLERAQRQLTYAEREYDEAKNRPWQWKYDEVKESYTNQLRDAELNLMVAEANYSQAKQAAQVHVYDVQIQEQTVELARMRLEQLESGLDVEQLRLTVESLKSQLSDARLIVPFDGKIMSLSVSEGRSVEAYRDVAILADPGELEISADLTDRVLVDRVEGLSISAAVVSASCIRPFAPAIETARGSPADSALIIDFISDGCRRYFSAT